MTYVEPVIMEALKAAMPKEPLTSTERHVMQSKIESLIGTLAPDGLEAAEILDAITIAVEHRYSNKLRCLETLDERHKKLRAAYEGIYESEEGGFDVRDQYGQ